MKLIASLALSSVSIFVLANGQPTEQGRGNSISSPLDNEMRDNGTNEQVTVAAQQSAPSSKKDTILIPIDTPVELMATKEISTAKVATGSRFTLRVNAPVLIDSKEIIPVGATAHGEVVSANDSGGLGKNGRMTIKLLYIDLDDVKIPLEGEQSAKGTGAGSAGAAIIFAGLAGLFHRGNNAKIKAGELVNGFIAQDVTLDLSGDKVRLAEPTDVRTVNVGSKGDPLETPAAGVPAAGAPVAENAVPENVVGKSNIVDGEVAVAKPQ